MTSFSGKVFSGRTNRRSHSPDIKYAHITEQGNIEARNLRPQRAQRPGSNCKWSGTHRRLKQQMSQKDGDRATREAARRRVGLRDVLRTVGEAPSRFEPLGSDKAGEIFVRPFRDRQRWSQSGKVSAAVETTARRGLPLGWRRRLFRGTLFYSTLFYSTVRTGLLDFCGCLGAAAADGRKCKTGQRYRHNRYNSQPIKHVVNFLSMRSTLGPLQVYAH